jgi:hypothetical protein
MTKIDPVKHCDLYKDEGCAHVDGFLCDMRTCKESLEYREKKIWESLRLVGKKFGSTGIAPGNKILD